MTKMLPCPFCGHEAATFDPEVDMVFCNECHAESGLDGLHGWNQRDLLGAVHAMLQYLKTDTIPKGTGEIFQARLARADAPENETPDANFHRELTEALVTLMKCIRAAQKLEPEADRQPQ